MMRLFLGSVLCALGIMMAIVALLYDSENYDVRITDCYDRVGNVIQGLSCEDRLMLPETQLVLMVFFVSAISGSIIMAGEMLR